MVVGRPGTNEPVSGAGRPRFFGAPHAPPLDIDGNGAVVLATDGQLILRHLLGFSDQTLTAGAVASDGVRDTAAIEGDLAGLHQSLDIDGEGADALTDGIPILRPLLGRTGTAPTQGTFAPDDTRLDPAQIAAYFATADPAPVRGLNNT